MTVTLPCITLMTVSRRCEIHITEWLAVGDERRFVSTRMPIWRSDAMSVSWYLELLVQEEFSGPRSLMQPLRPASCSQHRPN